MLLGILAQDLAFALDELPRSLAHSFAYEPLSLPASSGAMATSATPAKASSPPGDLIGEIQPTRWALPVGIAIPKGGPRGERHRRRQQREFARDGLVEGVSYAAAMHETLAKRRRMAADADDISEVFRNACGLAQLDEDFAIAWLAEHSELTTGDIVTAKA